MEELFKNYNIKLKKDQLEKFENFLHIFIETNSQINLSAIREPEEIIEKHFIDSILLNAFIDLKSWKKTKVADIWTWWWFPWIPLAITNPEVNFTLIDSVKKKLKQAEKFAEILKLNNINTIASRAEEIWRDIKLRESFNFVVSRATAFLPVLLEYSIPLLKVGGIFIAYKLDNKEELKNTKTALSKLNAKIIKIENYYLANQKRTLIIVKKLSSNYGRYPRKVWTPLKNPL